MKKTLALFLTLGGVAMADYTWVGSGDTVDATAWANQDNWQLSGSDWKTAGSGPGTHNSNMWDRIVIAAPVSVQGVTLEGWKPIVSVSNGADAHFTLNKIQDNSFFDVGVGSSLSLTCTGPYKDGTATYTVADANSLTITLAQSGGGGGGNLSVFNLGDTGSATLNSSASALTLRPGTINATLANAGSGTIVTRTLLTLNNISFSELTFNFGEGWQAVDEITGENQYKIDVTDSGISVSYMAVPEPATATLSLLALAGLCARRRR